MQISDNFSLVSNALDKLQGNTDLISLRSRKKVDYPFTVVEQLRKQAEARFLEEEEDKRERERRARARCMYNMRKM